MSTSDWNAFVDKLVEEGTARRLPDGRTLHEEKNYLKIEELFLFISVDQQGDEGVCAYPMPGMSFPIPMIAADAARLRTLIPMAEDLARQTGSEIKLIRFSTRETLQTIPGGKS